MAALKRFRDVIGERTPLDAITAADGLRYVAEQRRAGLEPATLNKHRASLKAAFNLAVRQLKYLTVNPLVDLRRDKVPDSSIRYIAPDEFRAIIAESNKMEMSLWWESFLTVSYMTATRYNEATHLTWGDVDFEEQPIRIIAKPELSGVASWRPKDIDSRTVPVPGILIDLLSRLHAEAEAGSDFIFIPPERVRWIRAKRKAGAWREGQEVLNNVNRGFKLRASKASVENVSLHDLRRSCISHWARKLTEAVVRELAGHADITTTLRYYTAIRPEDMACAREVTAEAIAVGPRLDPVVS